MDISILCPFRFPCHFVKVSSGILQHLVWFKSHICWSLAHTKFLVRKVFYISICIGFAFDTFQRALRTGGQTQPQPSQKGGKKYFSPPQKAGFLFLQMWSGHLHCAPSRNLDIHNMFFCLPDDICICWFVLSLVFRLVNTKPVGWFVQLCVLEGALNLIKHCVNIRSPLQKGFMIF